MKICYQTIKHLEIVTRVYKDARIAFCRLNMTIFICGALYCSAACRSDTDNSSTIIFCSVDLICSISVQLAAKAYFHRIVPNYFLNNYHSKHLWWSQDLDSETRTHVEGIFSYQKTNTLLRLAIDEIQNYTYFGMNYALDDQLNRTGLTGGVFQESGNINVLTAQLTQNFQLGPLNWENVITYQNSSNTEVLPLPALNVFSNLFLKFKIARVLDVELGSCVTYFTKYEAPDYLPMLNQFAIQQNADSRVELGGYPFVDIYANMQLKRARFFVAMTHVNAGSGSKMQFLTPHYPMNNRTFRMGISWTFIN